MLAKIRLLQMTSQTFPIGGYSHSYGLEGAVEAGLVNDEASVQRWIADVLSYSMGSYEVRMLDDMSRAWSARDAGALQRLNGEFLATREAAELRSATVQLGYSMKRLLEVLPDTPAFLQITLQSVPEPSLPCVWSGAADAWAIPAVESAAAYLYSWAENQVLVAMKSVPIGQSAGQRVLLKIGRHVAELAERLPTLAGAARSNFSPGLAILSAQHETQYSRLFRS